MRSRRSIVSGNSPRSLGSPDSCKAQPHPFLPRWREMAERYLSGTSSDASRTDSHTRSRFHCASVRARCCPFRGNGSGIRRSETRSQSNSSTNASSLARRVFASVNKPTRCARPSNEIFPRSFPGKSPRIRIRVASTFRPSLFFTRYGNSSCGRHPPCISRFSSRVQSSELGSPTPAPAEKSLAPRSQMLQRSPRKRRRRLEEDWSMAAARYDPQRSVRYRAIHLHGHLDGIKRVAVSIHSQCGC